MVIDHCTFGIADYDLQAPSLFVLQYENTDL